MNQTRLSPSFSLISLSLLSSTVVCGSCECRSHFTLVALSRHRRHCRRAPIALLLGSSTSYLPSCRSNSVLAPFCTSFLGQYIAFSTPFSTCLAAPCRTMSSTLFSAGTPFLEQCFHTTCLGDSSTLRRDSAITSSYNTSLSGPLPRTY